VKQVLTQQLQVYYEKITKAIRSSETNIQEAARDSLKSDPGIQALLPYFVVFIVQFDSNVLILLG
jgi:transcription initiation factor TFIID subunit 6